MAQACSIPVMQSQGPRPKAEGPPARWWWAAGFALDGRSLALLRVWLAVFALAEVVRAFVTWLPAGMLTDAGPFRREAWQRATEGQAYWTPYLLSGEPWFAVLLLALTAVAALVMLVGWHTRIATVLVWLLIAALHTRLEPSLLGHGEALLRLMLFWGIFLPLGARGSLDAALDISPQRPADAHLSLGSVALTVQILLLQWLFVAGILFSAADSLSVLAWVGVVVALLAPLLVLWPRGTDQLRLVAVALMLVLLTAFAVIAPGPEVGLLPAVAVVAWLVFVPASVWRALARRVATPQWRGLVIFYDGDCGFCQLVARILRIFLALPEGSLKAAQGDAEANEIMQRENSWVLRTADGRTFTHYDGFVEVLRRSPSGFVFVPLAGLKPVRWLGERIYRWIAANRDATSRAVGWLHYRVRRPVPGRIGRVMVPVVLVYVVGIALLTTLAPEAATTEALRAPAELLRLDLP